MMLVLLWMLLLMIWMILNVMMHFVVAAEVAYVVNIVDDQVLVFEIIHVQQHKIHLYFYILMISMMTMKMTMTMMQMV